jgi:uncharacterized protein
VCAIVLVAVTGVLVAVGWIGAERAIHPKPNTTDLHSLAEYPLPVQSVEFPSRDGTRLAGWFVPGRSAAATVVLLDGYGVARSSMLPHAAYLNAAGYNVLLFDFRASGESAGSAVTVGALEQEDALGALDYLAARGDIDMRRVGMLGVSMGAAVAIMTAAQDERVAAVVAEAPFEDVPSIIRTEYQHSVHLPSFPFAPITIAIVELRLGIRVGDISPLRAVAKLTGRPLLLIADAADQQIPPSQQQALFEAAGAPRQLWTVPGASHAHGHTIASEEYERRVLAFWETAFTAR